MRYLTFRGEPNKVYLILDCIEGVDENGPSREFLVRLSDGEEVWVWENKDCEVIDEDAE